MYVRKVAHPKYAKAVFFDVRLCWERCDHITFWLITRCTTMTTSVAMYETKVAHPKHLKMVVLEEHVRSCWGKMFSMKNTN